MKDELNVTGRHRPVPRTDMPPRIARVFAEAVASVDPEHFRACDAPMIEAYVTAVVVYRDLAERVEVEGVVLPDGRVNPVLRSLRHQQGLVSQLASRLRLTPSSRSDRKVAGTTTRTPSAGLDYALQLSRSYANG